MPQFDLATFPGQIFWILAIFALQYLIIARLVAPGFKKLFGRRQTHIDEQLKRAEELSKKSEELRLDYETKLEEVKAKHAELLNKAMKEIDAKSEEKIAALEKKFSEEVKQHEERFMKDRSKFEVAIDEATLDLASDLINKLTHTKVDKKKLVKYMN